MPTEGPCARHTDDNKKAYDCIKVAVDLDFRAGPRPGVGADGVMGCPKDAGPDERVTHQAGVGASTFLNL